MVVQKQANKPAPKARVEDQLIVACYGMTTEQFALHFTHRHPDSLGGQEFLPTDLKPDVESAYRALHARLHQIGIMKQLKHHHEPDPPEESIDRLISSLRENHHRGWVEIASLDACVAIFDVDSDIATRIDGEVRHHDSVEDATDWLLEHAAAWE
jgi:hypothetical protein